MNTKYLNVPCAFHPTEIVTNFCHARQCLLPLCRTCIPIHQRQHSSIAEQANIGDVFVLMDRVRSEIQLQRDELRRKFPLLAKQIKINQDASRSLFAEIQRERDEIIKLVTDRFNTILSCVSTTFEGKQEDLVSIHNNLEMIESTLGNIEQTLYRGKAMRSVIMWQSQGLYRQGLDTLKRIESQLLKLDIPTFRRLDKNILVNQLTIERFICPDTNVENKGILGFATALSKVVGSGSQETSGDTDRKSENRKSLNKLRNSGISLTEINNGRNEKRTVAGVRTPEKTPSTLVTVRTDHIKNFVPVPGVRVTSQNSRQLKRRSADSNQQE